jgi:AcrR family transcriptional regulator
MDQDRKAYHHGDLRRALLDAVLDMVAEQGDAGEVTMREVARRAGVSHGAPYRHFEDKDEILTAVAVEGFERLSRALHAARDGVEDDEERFVETGLAYLRFARTQRGYMGVMLSPDVAKGRSAELQRAANDTFQAIKDLAADAGITDAAEARRLGTVAWSFVLGLAILTSRKQVPASVRATPDELAVVGMRNLFKAFRACAPTQPIAGG